MKKHNEGYALVLVLVVITVLSLVAMAMTAASLKNLQNQQKSIERMEAKYAAQGEIEKAIAVFDAGIKGAAEEETYIVLSTDIQNADLAGIKVQCKSVSYKQNADEDEDYILVSFVTTDAELPAIKCAIKVTGNITESASTNAYAVEKNGLRWKFVSYTITEGGGA